MLLLLLVVAAVEASKQLLQVRHGEGELGNLRRFVSDGKDARWLSVANDDAMNFGRQLTLLNPNLA